jgi:hypothetical protein
MSKQLSCQKYIYKLHSGRLRRAKWKLTLPISEARRNDEVISLADSQILRWLDELNNITGADEEARQIKAELRRIRKEPESVQNRHAIRRLYDRLDALQFKPDYLCLVMDRNKDYTRACKGFLVNGIRYERLLGTNGGIKNSTIVFVSQRHAAELRRRITNGRDLSVPLVPAKLEAYQALTCSASIPVSMPHGILVVTDCETTFQDDILYLDDDGADEPVMEARKQATVELTESDGYGLMLPCLAQRWSEELGLDYLVSGVNTRFAWEKGMLFTFDFLEFADKVAGAYLVKDAWGTERDIRDVEVILTTSMLKLWDSYPSCEAYLANCVENHYTFGVAKTCPKELENVRGLNYQFIQSYDLNDDEIEQLIAPTMREFQEVLYADWAKTVLFLKGVGLDEEAVRALPDDYVKALMIDQRILDDPYAQSRIYQTIRHRINDAKVGVLQVHGNYSIVCGDPYALCQHIFGLPVTGLLRAGEIYNGYWVQQAAEQLACYRAPMTCHNNIRTVRVNRNEETAHWYRYMQTCTLFNAWDTAAHALNGMDKDGDLVMLTDNEVLVSKLQQLPALMCVQRKAQKRLVTQDDLIQSNIDSFGDDIGKTTNWITSMFDVQAQFEKGSAEYEMLAYRIKCGQLYQQNAIDKAKGILAKPMPPEWHDRHNVNKIEDEEKRRFYLRIVADRKPYFMRVIYPTLMWQYNTYLKNTNKNALREFQMTVPELQALPESALTERQKDFLRYYEVRMPVGDHNCVMNRICHRFEDTFDGYLGRHNAETAFDYTIMKSGVGYSKRQYDAICELCEEYNSRLSNYVVYTKYERTDDFDAYLETERLRVEFEESCAKLCSNRYVLCDILLDICYRRNSTKRFAWAICGEEIVENLLRANGGIIRYPEADDTGDLEYNGSTFRVKELKIGGEAWESY